MISDFLNRLFGPAPEPITALDARNALAALLVRIAKADGVYEVTEIQRIDKILARRFALGPVEAAQLRAEAEAIEHEAPDTVRFTRAIKESVAYEERIAVIEAAWEVVLADGARDAEEDALMRMIAPMLGIEDQDSAMARRKIEARRSA